MTINKQALRQLATDAHELGIIKRYTKGIEANKRFAAIVTPLTVLALLDELEADKEQIKTLESRTRRLEGIIDAAEKRIAELDARIYIPQPLNIKDEYQNYEYVAGWNDCRNATVCQFEHIDRDAGIKVKGE